MRDEQKLTLWRLLPVVLVTAAASFWIADVQQGGAYVFRNLVPLVVLILLCATTLHLGNGRWTGAGKRLPLGVIGYAIPALGLSLYLHYAYSVNLNDMFTGAVYPDQVFRYLPIYTMLAGGIGFAIGWIVGRNV
ncbi:MAG TPA: hypothetical protein PKH39_18695 [Woeseiaceae bacterium]|nr:hypothetical protein [Woeseiaceae bacterium]